VTLAVGDPGAVARRWADMLGVDPVPGVTFAEGNGGLVELAVEVPDEIRAGRGSVEIGGVRFRFAA
jgi:hypothetical protein